MEKPKILFVCVENSCRSQMAEGFARTLGKDIVEAYSAGSHPSGKINPDAVKVMQESGIDIASQSSKGFKDLPVTDIRLRGDHGLSGCMPVGSEPASISSGI